MSVASMNLAAAAGQLGGHFAAVGGYWMQYALPCPQPMHPAVVDGYCAGGRFADTAQDVSESGGGIGGGSAPLAVPETANGDLLLSAASGTPARVVLIVHALDSRAWQCAPDQLADCKRHIVIDAVTWVNGTARPIGSTSPQYDVTPKTSLDEIAAHATEPGEQIVTAYALDATHLNDVDPRMLGHGSGIVWYVRIANDVNQDGTSAGTARLISDGDGTVIDELPLEVAAEYDPARMVLDAHFPSGADSGTHSLQFTVLADGTALVDDALNGSTTPIAIERGNYTLRAYMADTNGLAVKGPTCDKPVTITTGASVAYTASFTRSACSWGPGDSRF